MEGAGGVLTNKVAKIQTITETIRGKCMSTDEICFMSATDLAEKVVAAATTVAASSPAEITATIARRRNVGAIREEVMQ